MTGSGLVEAGAIGEATVTAQAVGIDLETGERIVYSQDTGEVIVIILCTEKHFYLDSSHWLLYCFTIIPFNEPPKLVGAAELLAFDRLSDIDPIQCMVDGSPAVLCPIQIYNLYARVA